MPFEYRPWVNPYAATIADALARPGEIEAQRAQQIGQAQARAAEQSGAAWGGAAQQVGADVSGAIRQQTDPKVQTERLQLSEAQRGVQARTALGAAVTSTPHVDEDGVSLYDIPTISKKLEDAGFGDHVGDVATSLKGVNDMFRQERAAKVATVQRGAQSLLQANADPDLTLNFIDALDKNGSWPKAQLDYFRQAIQKDPTKTGTILRQFAGPEKIGAAAPGSTLYGETSGTTVTTVPDKPEKPTEASLAYDLTSPDPAIRARANTAMDALKGAKPGSPEDWVSRSRRLAVAQNGGKPLTDEQLQAVDSKSLQEFKETNADPEVRAAALAQKNLAIALAQMQQSQLPTVEQAGDVARDIVAHRLAPEQMSQMFGGFGASGQAFKRMVYGEAKKIDPEFNFEEASSEYALVKSPAFQQTVRYMDYVGSSLDNVIAAAQKLANSNIRSLNSVKNWTKDQLNNVDLGKFQTDRLEVADAIAKILQGGGSGSGTSDAKLAQAQTLLRESDSPENIAGKMGEIKSLIGKRRGALTRGTYMENATAPTDGSGPVGAAPSAPAGWKYIPKAGGGWTAVEDK